MLYGFRVHAPGFRRLCALVVALAGPALAQPTVNTGPSAEPPAAKDAAPPAPSRRLIRLFDFEEQDNPDPVPKHWGRAQDSPTKGSGVRRPGFPSFNRAEFDHAIAVSGKSSVRLPTSGGSTSLRLEPGEVPIFPDADYSVSAMVHTEGLEQARAFLVARLLDQQLRPISGAEVRSEPVLSPNGWTAVRIAVPGHWKDATWLQIDLELLQPRQYEPAPPSGPTAQHRVWREDVSGAALFDDVSIALLPRTRFWTGTAKGPVAGVFTAPTPVSLAVSARDHGGDILNAHFRLQDIDGNTIAERSATLDPAGRPLEWSITPPTYGWFRAVLDIDASGVNVLRSERFVVYVPGTLGKTDPRGQLQRRFGLIADTLEESALSQLPAIVAATRTGFLTIPTFDATAEPSAAQTLLDARAPIIERLLGQGQELTMALSHVPEPLAASQFLDASDAIGLTARDSNAWKPYLDPTLDVFGQRVARYQVGRFGDEGIVRQDPTLGITNARTLVSRLVPGPFVVLPWQADRALPAIGSEGVNADGVLMKFPRGFEPRAMDTVAADWKSRVQTTKPFELTVVPELPSMGQFGPRARAVETARRLVEFWAAMAGLSDGQSGIPAPRFALAKAFQMPMGEPDVTALQPKPEIAVLVHMADRLAGRRVIATVPAPEGVRAFLLAERTGRGETQQVGESLSRACVIAWSESAAVEKSYVDVFTPNQQVSVIDAFGNASTVNSSGAGSVQVRVNLNEEPVFIEGVDAYLALFSASLKFEPTFIPAIGSEHEHRVMLTNPWPIRITGQVQVRKVDEPNKLKGAEWRFEPNVLDFAAAPGQTLSLPVTLSIGPGSLASEKELVLSARVLADRQYPSIRVGSSVQFGLADLDLSPEVLLSPTITGPDVIVQASVTNKGQQPRNLRIDVSARDTPSQQTQIAGLPPGQTIMKRFVLIGSAAKLAGRHIRVTLTDEESAARMSKAAMVPAEE